MLASLIRDNIEARFNNQTVVYKGQKIKITKTKLDSFQGLRGQYDEYWNLFNALIDAQTLPKEVLPFSEDGLHEKKTVVFGIDECQVS